MQRSGLPTVVALLSIFGLLSLATWSILIAKSEKEIFIFIEFLLVLACTLLGRWLNLLALYLNKGEMPVRYSSIRSRFFIAVSEGDSENHVSFGSDTKAKLLCDIILIPCFMVRVKERKIFFTFGLGLASIGDLLQFFAMFFLLFMLVRGLF